MEGIAQADLAVPSSTRRTIITKFVLENFKSYAGIREIGPMHKRFLAVVGPNGSGKSNLIDALLFIFGKRAKKLRMKNLSSLIHNSAEHPNAKEARVEIHFCEIDDADPVTASDETDAYNPIPGSEFVLSRTVRLDNTAFYSLNGKRQTFEEVEVFMKTKGIDINNNRFLILQGEVEAISMMKPKGENKHEEGMLEFLEELIGTDRYVEDIEKSQALVEALSQNRALKLEQVKVGEKEMAALEGPKDEAMRFRFLEVSISETKCKIFSSRLRQCEIKCVEAEEAKSAVSETFANKKEELEAMSRQVSILDDEQKAKKNAHAQILKALEDHKEAYAKFERKHIKDETKSKQLAAKVEKNQTALDEARKTKTQEEEKIVELESEIPSLTLAVEKSEKTLASTEEELEQLRVDSREESRQIREKVEAKQVELVPLAEESNKLDSEVNLLERELALVEGPSEEAKRALPVQEKQIAELEAQLESLPKQKAELEGQIAEANDEIAAGESTLEEMRKKESTLENEVETLAITIKGAKVKSSSSGPSSGNGKGDSSVSKRLLDAMNKGKLSGYIGRLGDLGTVPDEYDTAVTTAAGNQADNHVVQTTEDAERCVEFFREEKLGVGTFIILDKVSSNTMPAASSALPAPRLVDIIQLRSPELLPAFYHVFRDTMVCADLDEATRIAYDEKSGSGKFRVVTMKGELIDKSGTMSGGGKPRKGGFLLASGRQAEDENAISEKEMKELQSKLDKAQKALADCRKAMEKEAKVQALMVKTVKDFEDKLRKCVREFEAGQLKLETLQSRLKELVAQTEMSKEDAAKSASLRKKIAEISPSREKARKAASQIEAELAQLNAALNEIGGEKGKQLRAKVEQARDKLDKARAALTKAQVSLESSRTNLRKAETNAEKLGAELEIALAEQETHEQERKKTEEKATEAQARFKQATEEEANARAVLEQTKREYNECKAKQNALESGSMEMKLKLESAEEDLKKALQRKVKWESELAQARTRLEEWRKTGEDVEAEQEPQQHASHDETETKEECSADDATAKKEGSEEEDVAKELSDAELARLENEVLRLEAEAKTLRGNVNMGAIAEYREREKEYLEKVRELDEASLARDQARAQCDELKKKRLVEFMHGFSVISLKLKEIYQLITLGGDAELELVDSLDPFSEGVVFSVRPPKKSWKNISNLSGGEKTLSSLSLVFALHAFRGAPIYVMDEIDAALDFKNVSIVANYIKERTKNAQFLIISLRNNMFELADRLVGVYKTNNATKSVTINPDRVAQRSGIASVEAQATTDNEIPPKSASKQKPRASFSVVLGERDENVPREVDA